MKQTVVQMRTSQVVGPSNAGFRVECSYDMTQSQFWLLRARPEDHPHTEDDWPFQRRYWEMPTAEHIWAFLYLLNMSSLHELHGAILDVDYGQIAVIEKANGWQMTLRRRLASWLWCTVCQKGLIRRAIIRIHINKHIDWILE